MRQHKLKTSADCGCDNPFCFICEGGLSVCKVCGGAGGDLPSECPGVKMSSTQRDMVYNGLLDYRNGTWKPGQNNKAAE